MVINVAAGGGNCLRNFYLCFSTFSRSLERCFILVVTCHGCCSSCDRKLADKVAEAGFYAVVPDFFYGDPYNPENKDRPLLTWAKDHGQVSFFSLSNV